MYHIALSTTSANSKRHSCDASLILIGRGGSGLSSLSVIAASTLGYHVIEVDRYFTKVKGSSTAAYIREHGFKGYCNEMVEIFGELLEHNREHSVIVCRNEIFEPRVQARLQSYGSQLPVIMVGRDAVSIPSSEAATLLEQRQRLHRKVSEFEFYNLPEQEANAPTFSSQICRNLPGRRQRVDLPQCLHHVKADFVGFLQALLGLSHSVDTNPQIRFPEIRPFTRALEIPLQAFTKQEVCLRWLDDSVDAFQLTIDVDSTLYETRSLDLISRSFYTIKRHSNIPIIYHARFRGRKESREPQKISRYLHLLRHGMRLLPEYLTVDLSCDDLQIARISTLAPYSKIIGHQSFGVCPRGSWTDKSRHEDFDRAVSLGCKIVRFEQEHTWEADNQECHAFAAITKQRSNVPVIAYNLGLRGRPSIIMNEILSPVTSCSLARAELGRQLVTSKEVERALYANFVQDPLHFHVFGANVDFSLSPAMYTAAFRKAGMEHTHSIRQSDNLQDFASLMDDSFGGSSLSLPFKTEAMSLLYSMSEPAEIIGAVNTVLPIRDIPGEQSSLDPRDKRIRNRSGKVKGLYGDNTDWIAMRTCISRKLSPANTVTGRTTGLVVGAGGMARAAIYALASLDVQTVVIWNRTVQKAFEVADHFNEVSRASKSRHWTASRNSRQVAALKAPSIHVLRSLTDPWPPDLSSPVIIVCTIPQHQIDRSPASNFTVPAAWFQSATGGVVVELSYKTPTTPLLQQVYENFEKGWLVVEPLEILVEQACAQFELFTGCRAPRKIMQEETLTEYVKLHGALTEQ